MHIEQTTCSVPGCYSAPIFAGLCSSHCTRSAAPASQEQAIRDAQRVIGQKQTELPKEVTGIEPNDIVKITVTDNPGRRGSDTSMSFRYPKYYKAIPTGVTELDIYMLCHIFQVQDYSGALHHSIKKILLPGVRTGGKSRYDDIKEARDTLTRWLEINKPQ